jgi:serine protease AprX
MSDFARKLIGLDSLTGDHDWTGEGETVGIVDSGFDAEHPDLQGRVQWVDAVDGATTEDRWGHGTHVAGIIAGSGAKSDGKIRGMAPAAQLAVLGIVNGERRLVLPPDIAELLHQVAATGAKIINLSWGTPRSGTYENGSMAVDTFMRERPDVLVVIAAGNTAEAPPPDGVPRLYTIGTPATSKNAVTVGACCSSRPTFQDVTWGMYQEAKFPAPPTSELPICGNPDQPAAFSSRGPVANSDSLGPNLLAPGTAILAARAAGVQDRMYWRACADYEGFYAFDNGTSMAAPVVSGAAAVIRQYLRQKRNQGEPSAALLKALLIAAADRIPWSRLPEEEDGIGYPDFDQGHGRLNLAAILPSESASADRRLELVDVPNRSTRALESRAREGSMHRAARSYRFTVREGAREPVRIVLAWSDHSVSGLQNNLLLHLQCPGAKHVGGNPDHRWLIPDARYLQTAVNRNNVERIDVAPPAPGRYRLRVIADNTLFPPQGFALVVCGELDGPLEEEE